MNRSFYNIIVSAALYVSIIFLVSCSGNSGDSLIPASSEKGVVDLSEWSFKDDGFLRVYGYNSEFYWNKLYTPEDFYNEDSIIEPDFIIGGHAWNGKIVNDEKLTEDGFATYRFYIVLPEKDQIYSFYMTNQDSAYNLWINGSLLAQNGVVARIFENYRPQRVPQLFHYYAKTQELEVVIQVANFTHKWGGATNNIYMGLPDQIQKYVSKLYWIIFFLLGSILIIAIYHLFLFINRRSDKPSLYFSLFCFVVLFRYLFTGDYLFYQAFPLFPLGVGIRLDYFSLYISLPVFVLFFNSAFPKEVPSILIKIISAAGFVLALLPIVTPVKFFTANTLNLFYIIVLIGGVIILFIMILAVLHKRIGVWLSLVGFLLFFSSVLYDIAANSKIILGNNLGPFIPAGLFIFILFQSFILSRRFSSDYKKLDNLTKNLEKLVQKRTQELQNAQAKNYEREKLAAIGTLVSGISHEIFNPLSGISGPLSIVKKEINNSELSGNNLIWKYIQYIENNVDEITKVVENLNALIKEQEINKETIHLIPVIEKVIRNYSEISNKTIDISYDTGENDEIYGESGFVYQIINNLVSNSINSIEKEGSISIRLQVSGSHSKIVVEDTGVGMSPEVAAKAFDAFFTTRETSGGRGLGLFLVNKLVTTLKWQVKISSQKDNGTLVTILL